MFSVVRFFGLLILLLSAPLTALSDEIAPADDNRWGLVAVSVASLRSEPSHASELETQILCGTPVEIIGDSLGWLRVRVPDGYEAYAHPDHIALKSDAEMKAWRTASRLILTAVQPQFVVADTLAAASTDSRNVVSNATLCSIFEGSKSPGANFAEVFLPDGRHGFLPAEAVEPFNLWAKKEPTTERILATAHSLLGTPYLWGGVSPAGVDCSGLTQLSYLSAGILLPRNASAQALVGEGINIADLQNLNPADLIFFAGTDTPRITHVALYDSDHTFVHSLGRVRLNSLDPGAPDFLQRRAVSAVRPLILPELRLSTSSLYFNL